MKFYNYDNGKIIHNKQMGWVIHSYVVESERDYNDVDDIYNICDNVALLYMWNKLEPKEGEFYFDELDKAIRKCIENNKFIHLRISTDPMIYNGSNGVPDWVFENYDIKFQTRTDYGVEMKYPDYLNPIYLEKMSNFLKVMANRYGHIEQILQIDLRGYGEWGEWHSGYMHSNRAEHNEALRKIIKVWCDAFKETKIPLAISSTYEWRADLPLVLHAPKSFEEYKYFQGFDYALKFDNVTFRRDGVGGAVRKFDMQLMEEYHFNGKHPMTAEYFIAYLRSKENIDGVRGYHIEDAIEEALQLHPNYMMLPWDSVAFYNERQDLVKYGLKRMGFRLIPEIIEIDEVNPNSYISIRQKWVNNAVGKLCGMHKLIIKLIDENGNSTSTLDETFETYKILNERPYNITTNVSTMNLTGNVSLYIGIVDEDGRFINLPLDIKFENLYKVGEFQI